MDIPNATQKSASGATRKTSRIDVKQPNINSIWGRLRSSIREVLARSKCRFLSRVWSKQKSHFFRRFSRVFFIAVVLAGSSYWGYRKIYKKRMIQQELLITGCARSGTAYISQILQECGLQVGHEKTQKDGVSSWYMCINTKHVPWAVDSRQRLQFAHIFHQVRHPLKVISSVQTEGRPSWKYIIKHIPEIRWEDLELVKCAKYWYYWNLKAEQQAEWTYRVEALDQEWDEFCRRLGRTLDRSRAGHVPLNVNARPHTEITWEDLRLQLDPDLYQKIRLLSQKYGYRSED